MKKQLIQNILSILTLSILFSSCGFNKDRIKGDKNIVTKEIKISDYNEVHIQGSADVIYEQKEGAPYLSVEIDANLVDHLNIRVDGQTLKVESNNKTNINPSKYIIRTNSKDLKKVSIVGSGSLTAKEKVASESLNLSISGSGDIIMDQLAVGSVNARISGSGDIRLAGEATNGEYNIAGSGDIDAKKLIQNNVTCKIAGSGDIATYAKDALNCSVAGSGDIKYLGTPQLKSSISGSGSVKSIN